VTETENVASLWVTEYVAEGATINKRQFEELVQLANHTTFVARKLTEAQVSMRSA